MAEIKKKKRLTREIRGKLRFTFVVLICLFLLLIGRIILWNHINGKAYTENVLDQKTSESSEIAYERGKIYDRNGNILAGNEKVYTMILEPKNIYTVTDDDERMEYLDTTVSVIAEYFNLDEQAVLTMFEENPNSYYVPMKSEDTILLFSYQTVEAFNDYCEQANLSIDDNTPEEEKSVILRARKVRGVTFKASYKRVYPYNSLACHLLGYTSSDNTGQWGIEKSYDSVLKGTNGRSYTYFDQGMTQEQTVKEAVDGNSVVSTIDLQIQKVIEEKLEEFDTTIGSKETSILVMNPNNGEILAMANSDPYDLNSPYDESYLTLKYTEEEIQQMEDYTDDVTQLMNDGETFEEAKAELTEGKNAKYTQTDSNGEILTLRQALSSVWKNPIISDTHEPGSTYKPFTVCTGLESGYLKDSKTWTCTGAKEVGDHSIRCSHEHGTIGLEEAVSQSCNVAMMNIVLSLASKEELKGLSDSEKLDKKAETFYGYQELFGFGKLTGIDLPGEASAKNLVYNTDAQSKKFYGNTLYEKQTSLATNSFGQSFNCTMIQMAAGFASLINGGYYYEPHVVKEIQNNNGDIIESIGKEVKCQTISESTSKKIKKYMKATVASDSGTGRKARIDGYSIGGKTGTAEKLPRDKENYYVSFMGFTPAESPELLIYVTIDEPNIKNQDNARLAVGLEKECMKEIVDILGIEATEEVKDSNKEDEAYYLDEFKKQVKKK